MSDEAKGVTPVLASGGFTPNQTSGSLLISYARAQAETEADPERRRVAEKKLLLLSDLYIKARSYAILNKVFFFPAVILGVAVLLWPAAAAVFVDEYDAAKWPQSGVVQTTVTGLAALLYALYSQYKSKQTYVENLMRLVLYSSDEPAALAGRAIEELAKIDLGFAFSRATKKPD